MGFIWMLSGAPGAGKTSLARHMQATEGGVHVVSDRFFDWLQPLVPPHLRQAHGQNLTVARACARAVAAYADAGYQVFLDGVIGPWLLPLYARELQAVSVPVAYVLLHVDLQTALARGLARDGSGTQAMIRTMHAQFERALGERAAVDVRAHRLDGRRPHADLAEQLRAGRGRLEIDLAFWAAQPGP